MKVSMNPNGKYRPFEAVPIKNRTWPGKTITKAPMWCSVDLRDGNQALINPMGVEQKLEFFDLLVKIGFKQIEVGFPSASDTEFNFMRRLIEENHVPEDVTLQVLCQAREKLIKRTFESLKGCKKAIFHLYNSTSPSQRKYTFNKSKEEIKQIAIDGIRCVKNCLSMSEGTEIQLEYSPESFSTTEIDYALEVCEAVKVLGNEYAEVLASSFKQRWADVYENVGKRSGAYSTGCYDVHPFMLLNHKEDLKSEFTLAHELGHSMHTWLSCKNQPPVYASYVLFVAEVASTCNEALLMQYLLKHTEDKEKRAILINHFLEQFRTTLYRQTMFAEFELKAHQMAEKGQTLTAKALNEMYLQLNKDYFGEDTVVDEDIAIEWARIPHFYRRFYVYQYSTGFSAAMALSKRILTEGEEAVKDYLKFLSGGCSTDPISLLKIAGVDMSTPDPVNSALSQFGDLIDELDNLING